MYQILFEKGRFDDRMGFFHYTKILYILYTVRLDDSADYGFGPVDWAWAGPCLFSA